MTETSYLYVSNADTPSMSQSDQAQPEALDARRPQRPQTVGYWTLLLSGIVFGYVRRAVSPHGFSPIQFLILAVCYRGEANTVTGIARVLPFDASAVSRRVEEMRAKGLLETRRSREDRRVLHVELTDEGQTLVMQLLEEVRVEASKHTAVLTNREEKRLISLMRKVVESVEGWQ